MTDLPVRSSAKIKQTSHWRSKGNRWPEQ